MTPMNPRKIVCGTCLAVVMGLPFYAALCATEGPSFDCAKAHSKIEKIICQPDQTLLQTYDRVLDTLYQTLIDAGETDLPTEQRSWLKRRPTSANALTSYYEDRLFELLDTQDIRTQLIQTYIDSARQGEAEAPQLAVLTCALFSLLKDQGVSLKDIDISSQSLESLLVFGLDDHYVIMLPTITGAYQSTYHPFLLKRDAEVGFRGIAIPVMIFDPALNKLKRTPTVTGALDFDPLKRVLTAEEKGTGAGTQMTFRKWVLDDKGFRLIIQKRTKDCIDPAYQPSHPDGWQEEDWEQDYLEPKRADQTDNTKKKQSDKKTSSASPSADKADSPQKKSPWPGAPSSLQKTWENIKDR